MGPGGLDELHLVLVEDPRGRHGVGLLRGSQGHGDVLDDRRDAVGQQLALRLGVAQVPGRAARVADVGEGLAGPAQAGAVQRGVRGAVDDEPRDTRGGRRRALEVLRVVAHEALRDELQQHRVVALERGVHVHVVVQARDAVLGDEAGAAAGHAGLLQRLEHERRRRRLERRRHRLEVLAVLGGVLLAGEDVVEQVEQAVVREVRRVRLGDAREQAAAVRRVVEQHRLLDRRRRGELAALRAVLHGDGQAQLGRRRCGAVQRHATLHQRAEHGEEATSGAVDRRRVGAVGGHRAVAREQVGARDAHVVEREAPVVDAAQAALEAVVVPADPGQELHGLRVAHGHVEAVHAVVDAVRDQLREDRRRRGVHGRVAEELLPRRTERRVDLELLRRGVVRGRGGHRRDVRAVPDLRHREGAGHGQVHGRGQQAVLLLGRAQVQDRRGEQAPLDARLDLQRRVGHDELLEARQVGARRVPAAEALREREPHLVLLVLVREQAHLVEHALAVLRHRERLVLPEGRVGRAGAGVAAPLRPPAEQLLGQAGDVDARGRLGGGRSLRRRGTVGRRGHRFSCGCAGLEVSKGWEVPARSKGAASSWWRTPTGPVHSQSVTFSVSSSRVRRSVPPWSAP